MLEEYIKDNYYARFDTCSYHCFREIHLNVGLYVKVDKWTDGNSNSYVAPCYKQVKQKALMHIFTVIDRLTAGMQSMGEGGTELGST